MRALKNGKGPLKKKEKRKKKFCLEVLYKLRSNSLYEDIPVPRREHIPCV